MKFKAPSHPGAEACITGVDFIGNLASGTSLVVHEYPINATRAGTFPRLSAMAAVFRRYWFKRIRVWVYGIDAATQSGYIAVTSLVTDDLSSVATLDTEAELLNNENVAVGRPGS